MSLLPEVKHIIDSLELAWFHRPQITDIKPTRIDNVYHAICSQPLYHNITLLSVECTQTSVSEFARVYSLPTHKYSSVVNRFRRYKRWLENRNERIMGFTEYEGNYYMMADRKFYHCYSLYGFCSACGILRCSPVWCICGHKQLSDGWTSNNKQLDDFIKKSQLQTNSPNEHYLEWIPDDYMIIGAHVYLDGLPTLKPVGLIPLEITDETDDLYYAELCEEHPDILAKNVWITIGFTYNSWKQEYRLIKEYWGRGLCLACTEQLKPKIDAFCYKCKAPRPPDWTTGNKSLDLFLIESWKNTRKESDAFIRWIEYSSLANVKQTTSPVIVANWLNPTSNKWTKVKLKPVRIGNTQSPGLPKLIREYPKKITHENILLIGFTQKPSTRNYYLVFYSEIHPMLDEIRTFDRYLYDDFDILEEIGSSSYRTVYIAKYKKHSPSLTMSQTVVLKRFKNFDQTSELFISEVRNHVKCANYHFLRLYGVTRDPETRDYMIVMQYANNGSLSSYLDQNINRLTWRMKLHYLHDIASHLSDIHKVGLVHCNLHGRNIILHKNNSTHDMESFICDLDLSRSIDSYGSNSSMRGVLPFVAPEIFHTYKFTQKSDIYSFGMVMYLMATGEQPFRDWQYEKNLLCDIMGGLRPTMPDSAPEEYRKLAERCCDADPDKRPDVKTLHDDIGTLLRKVDSYFDCNVWDAVYYNDVKPLSRLEGRE